MCVASANIEEDYTSAEVWRAMQLPGLIAAQDLPLTTDQITVDLAAALPENNPRPSAGIWVPIWDAMYAHYYDVLIGTLTPTEGAAAMQAEIP